MEGYIVNKPKLPSFLINCIVLRRDLSFLSINPQLPFRIFHKYRICCACFSLYKQSKFHYAPALQKEVLITSLNVDDPAIHPEGTGFRACRFFIMPAKVRTFLQKLEYKGHQD